MMTRETSFAVPPIEERGAWPFVSRRLHQRADGALRVWQSRHHRKGLGFLEPLEIRPLRVLFRLGLWMPGELNWWIAHHLRARLVPLRPW